MTEPTTPATEPASTPAVETAAATPTPETPAAEPAKKTEAEIIAGFDQAIAEDPEAAPEKKDDPPAAVAADKKPVAPAGKDGAAATPPKEKTDAEKAAEATETEIKSLGLKDKTAERFRELSKRPTPEAVEKQLTPLRERAEKADAWEKILVDSTAKPEQLSTALGYLQAINSGDPVSMTKAYEVMLQEVAWLGKQLGREVPGQYDPIAEHADLKKQVEDGDITRVAALEIARLRAERTRTHDVTARRTEETNRTAAQQQATIDGANAVSQLGRQWQAADPAGYAQKAPLLAPHLAWARANLEPAKWAAYVEHAYSQIKVAPAPAEKPPVGAVPLRPTGSSAAQRPVARNAVEAFDIGMSGA